MKRRLIKAAIIIIIVLVILFIGALAAAPFFITGDMLSTHIDYNKINPEDYNVTSTKKMLKSDDGYDIATYFVEAEAPKATIIIVSGIHKPSVEAFYGYAKMLRDNDYSTLLVQMRAHGESSGSTISLGMSEWKDVKAGVQYINTLDTYKDLPIITLGTSMGGATVLNAAGEVDDIDAVISISAFSSWGDVFEDNMVAMEAPAILAKMERPFANLYLGMKYGFDNLKYSPIKQIEKSFDIPVLLMHSTDDSQIPYKSYERLLDKIDGNNDELFLFTRDGDEHFICYDEYFDNPQEDKEFSNAVLDFLEYVVEK